MAIFRGEYFNMGFLNWEEKCMSLKVYNLPLTNCISSVGIQGYTNDVSNCRKGNFDHTDNLRTNGPFDSIGGV